MAHAPLRVALISEHASPIAGLGGVDAGCQNVYVAQMAKCTARAGHHVGGLARRDATHLPAAVDLCSGMRVLHIGAGPAEHVPKDALLNRKPDFSAAALQLLRHSVPYDVVHTNFFTSGLLGMNLCGHLRVPLVVTFRALGLVRREQEAFREARIAIEQQLVRTADCIVAECLQGRAALMRLCDASPARIATVPCGVDPTQFAPGSRSRARHALGLADDEFIVLQLGRIVPRKGIDNVIRAVARLRPGLRVRLLVVGAETAQPDEAYTPEIGRLQALARSCGIESRVTFVGQRPTAALREFYVAADVFVSTPRYEPPGITLLDAMAWARPVIGCAVGGIQFSVIVGVTGYHVPLRDPETLARRREALHDHPARAEAFGLAGERRVRERFTWEQGADALVGVYDIAGRRFARNRCAGSNSGAAPRRGSHASVLTRSTASRPRGAEIGLTSADNARSQRFIKLSRRLDRSAAGRQPFIRHQRFFHDKPIFQFHDRVEARYGARRH